MIYIRSIFLLFKQKGVSYFYTKRESEKKKKLTTNSLKRKYTDLVKTTRQCVDH